MDESLDNIGLSRKEKELIRNHRKKEDSGWKPRPLSDYTDEEKIEKFNQFYESAISHFLDVKMNGTSDEDFPHYMFENVMELLSHKNGVDVWGTYNKLFV